MEPVNYIFVFFMSLLGYVLGVSLGYIAPEELKPGHRYFSWLEKGLFGLSFLPIIYFFGQSFLVLLPLVVGAVFLFLKFKSRAYFSIAVFLLWFFLIRADTLVVILEASAIFLYGLPAGSLLLSPPGVSQLNKKVKVR